ncbi:hypothetical protein C8R47DRAFT_1024499 [Mycena vitilis]|nr:hypothetical protein C8R47DRAFT_1024499 [Mycena vitilis]
MSLDTIVQLALSAAPVPGLSPAFTVLAFIINGIHAVKASKKQLDALAEAVAKFLMALNSAFEQAELIVANCEGQLRDLKKLLDEIHQFVEKERKRNFFKAFVNNEHQIRNIKLFYQRIEASSNAFQISSAINIQHMLSKNELARKEDMDFLHARLQVFEKDNMQLREMLDLNQTNILDIMAFLQRRLGRQQMHQIDRQFCSHTLEYLASMSGQQLKLEDWTIPSLEIEYGPQIGSGGFGTVYRGTWKERDVAIKVLRNVAGVTPSLELMRKEIDIWLTLHHPNIIQFLGANILDDTPFLVMPYMPYNARQFLREHPDFDPINVLCDVSLGLQYLHAHRIFHGDIKGINILVKDSGRALLCDFGLSRIKSEITTSSIQIGHVVAGSRNWMAPELLMGTSPKTTSDIYAFGMTIYELYADETPLSGIEHPDFSKIVFETQRRPERPDVEDTPTLNDQVWALAEQCWLHDPKARPVAGTICDILAGIRRSVHSFAQIADGCEAVQPRIMYDAPEVTSETEVMPVAHTMRSLIVDPEPANGQSRERTLVHMASSSSVEKTVEDQEAEMKRVKKALGKGHENTLHIMAILVHSYLKGKQFSKAAKLGKKTLEKQKRFLNTGHEDTLHTMSNLANAYHELGKFSKAAELGQRALESQLRFLTDGHEDTMHTMSNLANTYYSLGQFGKAAELGETAMQKQTELLKEGHADTLHTMSRLANTYHSLQQFTKAVDLGEKTLGKQKQVLGEAHEDTLCTMSNLANGYNCLKQFPKAAELAETALKKQEQVLGRNAVQTLHTMSTLANAYHCLGQFHNAAEFGERALERQKQVLGWNHKHTLCTMSTLVDSYFSLKQFSKAAELGKKTVKKQKQFLRAGHEDTLHTMSTLMNTYHNLKQFPNAAKLGEKILEQQKQSLATGHEDIVCTISTLANIHYSMQQYVKAVELWGRALEKQNRTLGQNHQETLRTMSNLVNPYVHLGQYLKAVDVGKKAFVKQAEMLGERHMDTLHTACDLANAHNHLKQYSKAAQLGKAALEIQEQVLGSNDIYTLRTMSTLATAYHFLGELLNAVELGGTALEKQKQALGEDHEYTLRTMATLADSYVSLKQFARGAELGERALKKQKKVLGAKSQDTLHTTTILACAYSGLGQHAKAHKLRQNIS